MISLYVESLSFCICWSLLIILPPLCLSLQNYSISFFFFLFTFLPSPACLPPSFPLQRLWLASVKPLKRKCVCMHMCVCWSCWVGFEQAHACSAPVAYEMRKAATVLQTSTDKSTRVTPPWVHLYTCVFACVANACVCIYVSVHACNVHVSSDHLCLHLQLRDARIEIWRDLISHTQSQMCVL